MNHNNNVLRFWRAVETFHLPDLPSLWGERTKVPGVPEPGKVLPWQSDKFPPLKGDRQWRHTLYFYIVEKELVIDALAVLSGSKEFREPVRGQTFFAAMVLDHLGQPMERGYMPAAWVYGIKILEGRMEPEELPELLRKAQEEFLMRRQTVPDWPALEEELDILRKLTQQQFPAKHRIVCISEAVSAGAGMDVPFLNSYYLHDLNTLISHAPVTDGPLGVYLSEETPEREDLLSVRALLSHMHPVRQGRGRWPARPDAGLYSAQQAALYSTLRDLRQHSTLRGINGPPGTGKTTLLREVIADVVVERASRLLRYGVSGMFGGSRIRVADTIGYYKVNGDIFGNDGVVVSSTNNAAIENISRELPVLGSIDRETFGDADYFSLPASHIHEAPCWGMLSAVLGRADNRNSFISRFWFSQEHGFGKFLKTQYDPADALASEENMAGYKETAEELGKLIGEFDAFKALAGAYHEELLRDLYGGESSGQLLEELAERLHKDWEISSANLPGADILSLPLEKIHAMTPYSSGKINILRSRIFLLSLKLHHWAIRVNARQFNSNLNMFVDMVSGKHGGVIDEAMASALWNSFFFCIPVVSVTLASFQRQFQKMGKGAIGWLLLDEAGQATPASACGAIWRSERCIIIGDTRQIPPVVIIPAALGALLQAAYGIIDGCWNPVYNSAQSLADRITPLGTYIDGAGDERVWTGAPLRAHRRCSEPMFSIANAIAYNGQMVKVAQDAIINIPTGNSCWIDVAGYTVQGRHVIMEEIMELELYLQALRYYEGRIYVISPFAAVADICREKFQEKGRVACGTIHGFQGKEAEIVCLVLGTTPAGGSARDWVARNPNMLNVAITRAKERLYVIGNRDVWSKHRYFEQLSRRLPVRKRGLLL